MIFLATLIAWLAIPQNDKTVEEASPTAESVIEKFITAKGGESALRAIENYTITGKVISKNNVVHEFESYQAAGRFQLPVFLMELPAATEPMAGLLGG